MKRLLYVVAGLAVTLGLLAAQPAMAGTVPATKTGQAVLYKNPGCMCCEDYAKYLRSAGLKVKVVSTEKLTDIDEQHGVPLKLAGCHTMLLNGYVISGHVPIETIHKLLAQRPPIQGITLPGMPLGRHGGCQATPADHLRVREGSRAMGLCEAVIAAFSRL